MKKALILTIVLILLVSGSNLYSQSYFESKNYNSEFKHLVLAHPTVYNLETFVYLIKEELVELPNSRLVGVFHEKERYDYLKSKHYLDTCSTLPIGIFLHKVTDELKVEELYEDNAVSDDYEAIFSGSEGVVFFGGPDLPPATYGEKTSLLTSIYDPYRHYFELSFLFHLTGGKQNESYTGFLEEKPDYLVYGFCLGMQTMNVAAGGTMIQDIPTEVYNFSFAEDIVKLDQDQTHRNYYRHIDMDDKLLSGSFHRIKPQDGSLINTLAKNNQYPLVYSNHHQCVGELGLDYEVIARSMDNKIIEAVRHIKYPNVIGVQFHPEAMRLYNPAIQFRLRSGGDLQTGKIILLKYNSYQFHKAYWKDFVIRFNEL